MIDWITFWGLMIFNTLVLTGDFERFKNWMVHHATADIRIQTIMLAWAFGALLEGLVGFGYPWAVVVPILVGLGIADLDAIRVAALANNAPVSYRRAGRADSGLGGGHRIAADGALRLDRQHRGHAGAAAALGADLSGQRMGRSDGSVAAGHRRFAFLHPGPVARGALSGALSARILSGALVSFWILFVFVKDLAPEDDSRIRRRAAHVRPPFPPPILRCITSPRESFVVWLPYLVLIVVVVSWTGPWSHLPAISWFKLSIAAISSITQKPILSTFNFTPFAGGTSTLVSFIAMILPSCGPRATRSAPVFAKTFKQMWGALLVAFFTFALAYIFVFTGMANSLAYGLSKIGPFFVVLAPVLGWIGVALSGSNTSTNAMFGPVQAMTGRLLNLPVLLLPSFNSVGAEVGKPIAPQTASVGVSTSKLVRSEGQVIRHNMGWTLVMLAYLDLDRCCLFNYVFPSVMMR